MASTNIYRLIAIDDRSVTPKYLQLSHSIVKGIETGELEKDYQLPSINDLSFELDISRDTVEKSYKYLKQVGVIGSVPGKGYFIAKTDFRQPLRIFLLFNKLSAHKKIIYDSLAGKFGDKAAIDFYIYHNDFSQFKKLLQHNRNDYTHYIIIPHLSEDGETALSLLSAIPQEKLILLDKLIPGLQGSYGAVYENFEKDIYGALEKCLERLKKYHTLRIIFPEYTYHPREILNGFTRFCHQYAFAGEVVNEINREIIQEGSAYISLMENDLVILVEKILETGLPVGEKVGVISYNETPLKKIILHGITTISTDFQMMGEEVARLVMEKSTEHIEIPFQLTLRQSL